MLPKGPHRKKIENAIAYFADKHYSRRNSHINQTLLFKCISFFEHYHVEKYGIPSLGLTFKAMENGPVPPDLYHNKASLKYKSDIFYAYEEENPYNDEDQESDIIRYVSQKNPDMDYFSENEKDLLRKVSLDLIRSGKSHGYSKYASKKSHEEITAWRTAYYDRAPNSTIDWKDTFPEIENKKQEELSEAEERFLFHSLLKSKNE
jgi:hypothetical protein